MTSHLITDSFVSGVAFFPLLVSSLSPLIPFPFRFSKKSGKVVLPSSCGFFLCVFFVAGENSVGSGSPSTQRRRRRRRQRRRRDVGPCGSSSSRAGRFVHDRPGVAADRAEPSTRRDLCWLLWKETRQEESGGGKSQREGRETLTDKRERERDRESARTAWVWRRGSRSAVSRSCHWGQRAGASTTPRQLPCACPYRRAHARGRRSEGEGGEGGGCSRSPALCCIHLLSEMASLVKWMKWVKMIRQDEYFFVCGNNNVALE